jgi:hypothetical protein
MRAVAVLVVTAAAAVLLAVVSHLAWPPVVLGILCTFPALYLAWLAVPGVVPPPETAGVEAPARGRQVAQWDLRRLGVHAAISVPGVADAVPPEYVPRDVDESESGVRALVAAAAERGGFVLLVGGSSVGKTRSAAQAVMTMLPDWQLVRPGTPGQVAVLAAAPARRTVVWLDELQQYLDGKDGLTAAVIRALVHPPHPAVVIGTLWPELYTRYTSVPKPGGQDLHATERQLLDLATVVRIGPAFTDGEKSRARAAAARDPRLKIALDTPGYGLTQTLAAAPQLIARWHDAQTADPYAWAVLTAALDAARLGARGPLSEDFLRAAAPGYLTSQQQAQAPGDWFARALDYAQDTVYGAAAPLTPAGAGMGQTIGYTPADYLIQHATQKRRGDRVPSSTWDAALDHVRVPADAARLGYSAEDRLLYCYAIPLYRRAAAARDWPAARQAADLLAERGDLDEAEQILRPAADAGDRGAARELAELLAQRGDLDGLRARADAGDLAALRVLELVLLQRGDRDEAEQIRRARADAGDWVAPWLPAKLRAQQRDEAAARERTELLAQRGDLDALRARADAGDGEAARSLAELLAQRGDLDALRARADAGDGNAARSLADLLAQRGDLDALRARADAGDGPAAWSLVRLLAQRGDLDGLRARADAGDGNAARWLPGVLAEQGRGEEAERLRRFGLNPDGSIAGPLRDVVP